MGNSKQVRQERRFELMKSITSAMVQKYGSQGMKPALIASEAMKFTAACLVEIERVELLEVSDG